MARRILNGLISSNAGTLAGLALLTLLPRTVLASMARYPGHGDPAFYYAAAQEMAAGRGPTINFIWHFLSNPPSISHYAFDLWAPLTSAIIAAAFVWLGPSMQAALVPGIAASVGIVWLAYAMARWLAATRTQAVLAAALVSVIPAVFAASLASETTIYACLLGGAALWSAARGGGDVRRLALAGVLIGLAYANRTDGLLLLPAAVLGIWATRTPGAMRATLVIVCAFMVTALPVWLLNFAYLGAAMPGSGFKMLMITQYEDLYSFGKDLSVQSWLAQGVGPILDLRWRAIARVSGLLFAEVPALAVVLLVTGAAYAARSPGSNSDARQRAGRLLVTLGMWLAISLVFYTMVAPHNGTKGAFAHSVPAAAVVAVVCAVVLTRRVFAWAPAYYLMLGVLGLTSALNAWQSGYDQVAAQNDIGEWQVQIASALAQIAMADGESGELIMMTRNPFEFTQATGYRSVQIPNNDLDTIYKVAQQFKVNYIYLPAPRAALERIYNGTRMDDRFEFRADMPGSDQKFFRIRTAGTAPAAPAR